MALTISVGNPCIGYDEAGAEQYRRSFEALRRALAEHASPAGSSRTSHRRPARCAGM
jgi:hypothetical protein